MDKVSSARRPGWFNERVPTHPTAPVTGPRAGADHRARDTAQIAVFAAFIAALTLVPAVYLLGGAVPLTLQTLAVTLAAAVLGPRKGALAVLVYLAMIAVGLPVGAGYSGGLGVLAGPTGGYLVGFVLAALVVGTLARWALRLSSTGRGSVAGSTALFLACLAGIPVVYAVGVPWLALSTGMPFGKALSVGALVFLPGDVLKAAIAAVVTAAVARALPHVVR